MVTGIATRALAHAPQLQAPSPISDCNLLSVLANEFATTLAIANSLARLPSRGTSYATPRIDTADGCRTANLAHLVATRAESRARDPQAARGRQGNELL